MNDSPIVPKSHIFGAILLVAGCCIGAGMLGLPVLTSVAGFKPSLLMFFLSWLFMFCTGLLLLEANLFFKDEVNIVSMAERTLGTFGKISAWLIFGFLFYCLLVAYISGSGSLVSSFAEIWFDIEIPRWIGSVIVTLLFGCMLYVGTVAVDTLNKLLMLGLILSYLSLVGWGSPHVDTNLLKYENWSASFLAVPAMIISFGFHNLVPTISHYLERNEKILVKVFFIGSALPLLLYITWEWLILGLVPAEGVNSFAQSLSEGEMATHAIKNACKQPCVVHLAHTFAFFALITSFLGVALSFVDFLADGFKIEKTPKGKFILCQLVLIPPLLFSLFYPTLFLTALGYAGGYGAILLFGILPIAMVWAGRYNQKRNSKLVFPGGKLVLIILAIISGSIIILKTLQDLQ